MVTILTTAVNAVGPVVLMILLGYLLKQHGFLSESFIKTGNKLVFNVFLPCMLFINVYDIAGFSDINWEIAIYCVGMLLVIFVLGFITAIFVTKEPRQRGVIWQCSFRSNFGIIGLSLAGALGGDAAVAVAAIMSSFTVPMYGILGVICLSVFVQDGNGKQNNFQRVVRNIFSNPQLIAVLVGLACLGIRELQIAAWGAPVFTLKQQGKILYTVLTNLKAVASPFALLMMGGQFEFSAVKGMLKEIATGTVWRVVVAPLLGIGGAILLNRYLPGFHCGVNEFPAMIALFGSPVAVSSAVMAASMGSDEQLATQLVVWTTLFSVVTIFAQVCILMSCGLLAV